MSSKITQLTVLSAPASTDVVPIVDLSGTPTTKKSTLAQLSTAITLAISQVTGLAADLATRALASITLTAGGGLTGGGDLSTNRTFAVGAGTGITVNADDVAVNYGTTSTTACIGNDSRLSDARTPTAHASSHQSGGGDAIKLDDLAAPDDNTDLDASTSKHGLVVKATAPASGLLSAVGIGNGETAYTMKPLFDTTNPTALGTAAPGTQVIAARRDHVHPLPTKLASRAHASATQSLSHNTNTAIIFGANDYDYGSIHSTSVNNTRFTVPTGGGGIWLVTTAMYFTDNTTGTYALSYRVNAGTSYIICEFPLTVATEATMSGAAMVEMADGDYLELIAYQFTSGGHTVTIQATFTTAQVARIFS